jgi:hypothetical protein
MIYLKKFETDIEKDAWQKSTNHVYPNAIFVHSPTHVEYNIPPLRGVFIQHTDGTLYRTDEWKAKAFANDAANGIAVVDDRASFVIAKEALSGNATWSSDMVNKIEGVTTALKEEDARADYRGYENTLEIAKTDTKGCAYLCVNYSFPNGAAGYMPAAGEWNIVLENWDAINSAMTIVGAAILQVGVYYWTSTQYNSSSAWIARDFKITPNLKNYGWWVRPFTRL